VSTFNNNTLKTGGRGSPFIPLVKALHLKVYLVYSLQEKNAKNSGELRVMERK